MKIIVLKMAQLKYRWHNLPWRHQFNKITEFQICVNNGHRQKIFQLITVNNISLFVCLFLESETFWLNFIFTIFSSNLIDATKKGPITDCLDLSHHNRLFLLLYPTNELIKANASPIRYWSPTRIYPPSCNPLSCLLDFINSKTNFCICFASPDRHSTCSSNFSFITFVLNHFFKSQLLSVPVAYHVLSLTPSVIKVHSSQNFLASDSFLNFRPIFQ